MNCKKVGIKLGLAAFVTVSTLTLGVNAGYAAPAAERIVPTANYQADFERSYLVADEPSNTETRITSDFLNVRTEPNTDSNILGVLNIGVELKGTPEGEWFKIKYNGQSGFVHADWLRSPGASKESATTQDVVVEELEVVTRYTTDNLNVRSGQGTDFNILGVISTGEKVSGSYLGEWFRIEYKGQTAYVHTDYLKGTQEAAKEAAAQISLKTQYTVAHVNVRSGPGTKNSILGVLNPNSKIEGNYDGHWFKTQYNGNTAYVSGSYLSDGEAEVKPTEKATEKVSSQDAVTKYTTASLNVRKGPGTGHSILGVLNPNTEVSGASKDGWFQIEYKGQIAFVSDSYLRDTRPQASVEKTETESYSANDSTSTTNSSAVIQAIVADAYAQVGKSYVYGTAGPSTFDCSGLTYYLYNKHAGIQLPRSSGSQATAGTTVSKSDMQPGDLIFFINDGASRIGHVGIYVGNGQFVHASTPATGVKTDSTSSSYFKNNAVTIKRILP